MMHPLTQKAMTLVSIATLAVCSACSPPPAPAESADAAGAGITRMTEDQIVPQIAGSISYRERMALSPTAQLNIQLQDVSLMDIAATIIAEKEMTDVGQVPISFTLDYDPAVIKERNNYAVRAVIRDSGQMLFTTDTAYPVITRGNTNNVDMVLKRVAAAQVATGLTDTYWQLSAIDGDTIVITEDKRAPYLQFMSAGNVAQGYSGCNQFTGSWKISDEHIELGPMAMTMMACADDMGTETAFMRALDAMDRHEIQGDELRMYQDDAELLLFRAAQQPR